MTSSTTIVSLRARKTTLLPSRLLNCQKCPLFLSIQRLRTFSFGGIIQNTFLFSAGDVGMTACTYVGTIRLPSPIVISRCTASSIIWSIYFLRAPSGVFLFTSDLERARGLLHSIYFIMVLKGKTHPFKN